MITRLVKPLVLFACKTRTYFKPDEPAHISTPTVKHCFS